MAGATKRCEFACDRINFNPIDHTICCGLTPERHHCSNSIPLVPRQIAYFIVGHGSHLASDDDELRQILLEAAELLYCCEGHKNPEALVDGWLLNWQERESVDRRIATLVEQTMADRIPADESWRQAFEKVIDTILASKASPSAKLARVREAIMRDRARHQELVDSEPTLSGRAVHSIDLPRTEALHLIDTEERNRSSRPRLVAPAHFPATMAVSDSDDQTVGQYPRSPVAESAAPIDSRETAAAAAAAADISETPHGLPRRKLTFSSMGGTLMRALSQGPTSTKPRLTLRTAVPPASTASTPASSTSMTSTPTPSRRTADSLFTIAEDVLRPMVGRRRRNPETTIECDICVMPFDTENRKEACACPSCKTRIHYPCWQNWNLTNYHYGRQTPCPYCRFVMSRPTYL